MLTSRGTLTGPTHPLRRDDDHHSTPPAITTMLCTYHDLPDPPRQALDVADCCSAHSCLPACHQHPKPCLGGGGAVCCV